MITIKPKTFTKSQIERMEHNIRMLYPGIDPEIKEILVKLDTIILQLEELTELKNDFNKKEGKNVTD